MYLMYCDESNLEVREGTFFVYGGVAVSSEKVAGLSEAIEALRVKFSIPRGYHFKFNPPPPNLAHAEFIELKKQLINLAAVHGCVMFTSIVLHDIAKDAAQARRNEINRVCYHFDCFLNRKKTPGLILIDRFDDNAIDHHLREKFSVGLTGMPYSKELRLKNIVGFHYSAIGQSHLCTLVDVLVGSFRFAISAITKREHEQSATRILNQMSPLFFREQGESRVSEIGVFFSPKTIKIEKYRKLYVAVHEFFANCGVQCQQEITSDREY